MAEAVRAAVDAIVDGAQAAPAEVETQAADAPAEAAPAGAPAAPPAPPTEDRRRADLAELQAFARAQANWSREKAELAGAAVAAESKAKAAILAALDSDEPDAALAELGLSVEQRRALASRMVLRHVPEDQAPPELRAKIREDNLRAEVRKLGKEFEQYKKAQDEGRERERQETAARETTRATLETLHEAFRSAGDDAKLVRSKYAKRTSFVIRDAIELGKQLATEGKIPSGLSDPQIARFLVTELERQYREDFALDAQAPAATAPPSPPIPLNGRKPANQIAAEGHAARTLTRSATAVTRPPPAEAPRSEDDDLRDMAAEMARARREGHPLA